MHSKFYLAFLNFATSINGAKKKKHVKGRNQRTPFVCDVETLLEVLKKKKSFPFVL